MFVLGTAGAATATGADEAKGGDKVWVCKYSGDPKSGFSLKDGKQPIHVSASAIAGDGTSFKDAHPSIVVESETSPCPEPPAPEPTEPTVVALQLTYMVDCNVESNRWRVVNPSDESVTVTYGAYGSGETQTFEAPGGESSYFETSYGSETMIITWGDGETIAKGKQTKASGPDAQNCEPTEPTVVALQLTYMVDCNVESNRWRVVNPSDESVTVTYGAYGSGETQTFEAPGGESSYFETPYGSETMIITWGDGETIAKGKQTKASGPDAQNCEPTEPTVVALQLTYMVDCNVESNRWRVVNPSDESVTVTYGAYGSGETQTFEAPGGESSYFETSYGSETMIITWGDGETIAKGKQTKASGPDSNNCGPNIPQKPRGSTSVVSESRVDCFAEEVVTTTTTTVVDHVWGGEGWQRTEKVSTSTEKVAATPGELNNADCPIPEQPSPDVKQAVDKDVDCDDKVVTVTTLVTTTPYVWSAESRTWAAGAAQTETFTDERKPRGNECPRVLPAEGEEPDKKPAAKPDDVEPDQVQGVDSERPKPRPAVAQPEALPTAVDAGLAPVAAGAISPLGQGLLASGVLMLLLAGALQSGRRERGAHEH